MGLGLWELILGFANLKVLGLGLHQSFSIAYLHSTHTRTKLKVAVFPFV
jgi:hypothetical protein